MASFFDPAPGYRAQDIGVLLLPEFSNLTLAAIVEPLRSANRAAGRTIYGHRLLSESGGRVTSSSGLGIDCEDILAAREPFDLLLVVASYNVRLHAGPKLLGLPACRTQRGTRRHVSGGGRPRTRLR